jgi:enoyl-CoA hydratase
LRPAIDALFTGERAEDILAALDRAGAGAGPQADFARKTAATIRTKSPLSLKVTLRQMRLGKSCNFDQCIRTEFRIVSRVVRGHDLYEGIRAVIVDKDQAPRWQSATLEAVDAREVERHFDPVENELRVP